jgi:4-hydroxy-tetrahydrodipicolinate reductase
MIYVKVFGKNGRIAQLIDQQISKSLEFSLENTTPDVLIDFTHVSLLEDHIRQAIQIQKPIVIGTTGLSPQDMDFLKSASTRIKIFYSPNMSTGIEAMRRAMNLVSPLFQDHNAHIHELHHKFKKDAPSGTALMLAQSLQDNADIGMSFARGGSGYNTHTVSFIGDDGMFEIKYHNWNPETYAIGALRAAKFLTDLDTAYGFYTMKDLI